MGARKRLLLDRPRVSREAFRGQRSYTRKWLRNNLIPIDPSTDVSFEWWINDVKYPVWRKQQLAHVWIDVGGSYSSKYTVCKSFIKDEKTSEYKHARLINSRTDAWKTLTGPIFRRIDNVLFKLPQFIKTVSHHDRGKYIMQHVHLPGFRYMSTDYTSYEGQFQPDIMRMNELELYKFMLSRMPDRWLAEVTAALTGTNKLFNRNYMITLIARRMSGEMCTSSGNGFTNLMAASYLFHLRGVTLRGVVEGDDGLFAFSGVRPSNEDFARLGLSIKIEEHDDVSTASFCGLIFDPVDKQVVTNPIEEVVSIGWGSGRYAGYSDRKKKILLRARAMSLAAQYPRCPILGAAAERLLKETGGADVSSFVERDRHLSEWDRDQLRAGLGIGKFRYLPPSRRTYDLVYEKYGISVEIQRTVENHILSGDWTVISRLVEMPWQWSDYYGRFAIPIDDRPYPTDVRLQGDLAFHA